MVWDQMIDKITTHKNNLIKCLTLGTELISGSSVGTSLFIRKYTLYHIKSQINTSHSRQRTLWSQSIRVISAVINKRKNQSLYTNFFVISIGVIMALNPNMNHKLNMFDHITFHTDREPLPLIAAIADKNNSGADVPKASTVRPMNNADILKYLAILTLELIKWLAANQSKNNHIASRINADSMICKIKSKTIKLVSIWKIKSMRIFFALLSEKAI